MFSIFKKAENEREQRRKNTQIFCAIVLVCIAVALLLKGENGTGQTDASQENAAQMEKAAVLVTVNDSTTERPESGTVFYRKYDSNPAGLHMVNSSTADIYAQCADAIFNSPVIKFYLRAGEEITLDVPVGYYELHIATGEHWQDESTLFGEDTLYFKDTLSNGLEFSRKKVCEFEVEEELKNLTPLPGDSI